MAITTQKELRKVFHSQNNIARRFVRLQDGKYRAATQNEYPADIRMAWVDFVDAMTRCGEISEALADRATL